MRTRILFTLPTASHIVRYTKGAQEVTDYEDALNIQILISSVYVLLTTVYQNRCARGDRLQRYFPGRPSKRVSFFLSISTSMP